MSENEKKICELYESDVNEIIPSLYLGNNKASYDVDFLTKYKITHIIRVMKEFDYNNMYNTITYFHIPIEDNKICTVYKNNINNLLDFTSDTINKLLSNKNNNILVHCKKGHHRSAVVICAFLIKYLNVCLNNAVLYIHKLRLCALTRDSCMVKALLNYNDYLLNKKIYKLIK